MPAPIKTAILGTGIALNHLHWPLLGSLPDMFEVTTVMERKMAGVAKSVCGDKIDVVATLDEVLANKAVELVVVTTSDKTHFDYCKRSLRAGKHVFSEKPLTYSSVESEELEKLAREAGKILGVFQCRRWDGDYLTVKRLIESNTLGPICSYEVFYDFYRPADVVLEGANNTTTEVHWKDDPAQNGGGIYATGTHIIDQVWCLFGFPEKILGRVWGVRGHGVDDCFDCYFMYPARPGSIVPLFVRATTNWISPLDPQPKFVIKASKGGFVKHYEDDQWFALDRGEVNSPSYGTEPETKWGTATLVQPDGSFKNEKIPTERGDYRQVYRELAESIWANDPSKNTVQVSVVIEVLKIIELSLRSAKENRWLIKGVDY
ncbi:uncharacterized protein PV07_12511 [Cladophialophora immunda]|uniref:Gfo/Idh/MocA-like oxidoreductase N-terminal domain-containing protein n=1 Tax=Cladophialophora immunda TaxID=569365 RepID=A0A0D2CEX3_9EURO|nr:uncharacterized protein PV07_12511 [Cladophialophora immunda]KIW22094.1 hypothetical protein PV07_12511 [Cladophialophora immunda]